MSEKNLALTNDINELLSLADKKGLSKITDIGQKLSRLTAITAYKDLTDTNNNFFNYVDIIGNKSTGAKGMIIAFNVKFKKEFGFAVDNINSELQNQFVRTARLAVSKIMANGIASKELRDVVKNDCWAMIAELAASYKKLGD